MKGTHFLTQVICHQGVVVSSKNSASLSPTVSKASAGALEVMSVHSTKNMVKFLDKCKGQGYHVLGTSLGRGAVPLSTARGVMREPCILVLGNEGHGLRTNVKTACDTLIRIDGAGVEEVESDDEDEEDEEGLDEASSSSSSSSSNRAVDSLNVSVTGGILMHELLRAHDQEP